MRKWRKVLHWIIITNFIIEIGYGLYMVFFVVGGGRWPLMAKATQTPIEVILKRRLYAIEAWIAIAGLAVYLALTEFLPNKITLQSKVEKSDPTDVS
ncbi:MAG: hypothetical protein SVT56_08580 [Chloroflexota bacterium]|jgi:hypothetical protein|nr:hypothetical protein [Chloroflexota bacterium]